MNVTASPLEFILTGRSERTEPASRPLIEAQRLELLARYARHEEQHVLKPGELVAEKEGMSFFKLIEDGKIALILWRYLDLRDFSDRCLVEDYAKRLKNYDRFDCMVAWVDRDGNGLEIMPYCASRLRPLDEKERSALQAVIDHPADAVS